MLNRLTVQNVALIERADVEFSEGLNVISGETGAGKSVLLDSIDFVLGAKADKSMIRYGADECTVRAEFSDYGKTVSELLKEFDIEPEDVLVISRKFTAEGKGGIKINGCGVTVSMLRRIGAYLVDVHGQSDHFFLLEEGNQLRLLDAIAGEAVAAQKETLGKLLSERKDISEELKSLGTDEGEREREADILRYQIAEIERADLKEGEEEELLALKNRFFNSEKLLSALRGAEEYLLSDGNGGIDAVHGAIRSLIAASKYDPAADGLSERLRACADELSDVASAVESLAEGAEFDEEETERIENRLDEIKTLKKKYGADLAQIQTFYVRGKARYELLTDSGERFGKLSKALADLNDKIYACCTQLSALRKQAAEGFTARVTEELRTLNISSAHFRVQFDEFSPQDAGKAGKEGLDKLRFLFSANAGEPLKELGKIISGGEMSRFMLAVKAQLSAVNEIGTYLFDEIDAGIGGKTARVVAEKFAAISKHVQIIAVSHLAQIASFADREFLILKTEEAGKTVTLLSEVTQKERIREISRLIGGDPENATSLRHAEELLVSAQAYKKSH